MKLIILDRDGVINEDSDAYIKSPEEWRPIAGSLEAIRRLHQAGYRVVVLSNQSGVGRGLFDLGTLNRIHEKMLRQVAAHGGAIDAILYCPHAPEDGCSCRKPAPGLFTQLAARLATDLHDVVAVGDSARDVAAARAAGAIPVLVRTGKGQRSLDQGLVQDDVAVFDDLAAATEWVLHRPDGNAGD